MHLIHFYSHITINTHCHDGLLFKVKRFSPPQYYPSIKSYLNERYFGTRVDEENIGILSDPHGNVLGPFLYLVFTSDFPNDNHHGNWNICWWFSYPRKGNHTDPDMTYQNYLNQIPEWLEKWRTKINATKSHWEKTNVPLFSSTTSKYQKQ